MKLVNEWRDAVAKVGLFLAGLGSVVYGSWLIYRPAGYILGGLLCVFISLVIDKATSEKP